MVVVAHFIIREAMWQSTAQQVQLTNGAKVKGFLDLTWEESILHHALQIRV
jgi:hypothetical protein